MTLTHELKLLAKVTTNFRGQREVLLREYFFRAARRFTPLVAVEDAGVRFLVSTDDDVIGRATFMYKGFDEAAMHRLIGVLAQETGAADPLRGRTILDVGGNIGTTSVYAVARFGAARAIAFEPEPGNLALLRQNVAANALGDRIDVHPVALSDADGEVSFELSPESGGDHRVRVGDVGAGAMGEAAREVVRVPAKRLDAFVGDGSIALGDVALMWIDVQGHESHVLSGASEVLAADIPIAIEYWPYGLERAGGLQRLHELIAAHRTTVVDLGPPFEEHSPRRIAAARVAELATRYCGESGTTDLLLL